MDDPALDPAEHAAALRGLARLNWISGSAGVLWRPIAALSRRRRGGPLRVLDVATGGGDVPVALWRLARANGCLLTIDGCDRSATAVANARERAQRLGAPIRFMQLDVLNEDLPAGYDVVMSSLFFHHLTEPQIERVLAGMASASRELVLINDLVRSAWTWCAVWLGSRALTRSRVVRIDSLRSVRAALTLPELRAVAARAGLASADLRWQWPCRALLTWSRHAV